MVKTELEKACEHIWHIIYNIPFWKPRFIYLNVHRMLINSPKLQLTMRKPCKISSLDEALNLDSITFTTVWHSSQGVTSLATECELLASSLVRVFRYSSLLQRPATEQTTWGFISDARVSIRSGMKLSTILSHSLTIGLKWTRAQVPSKTSLMSSWNKELYNKRIQLKRLH